MANVLEFEKLFGRHKVGIRSRLVRKKREALEVAVDHVLQISWLGIKTSAAAFMIRGQQLRKVVSRNLPPAVDQCCARVAFGQCLCGRVAESGKPIV